MFRNRCVFNGCFQTEGSLECAKYKIEKRVEIACYFVYVINASACGLNTLTIAIHCLCYFAE